VKRAVKKSVNSIGLEVGRYVAPKIPESLERRSFNILRALRDSAIPGERLYSSDERGPFGFLRFCAKNLHNSKAQLLQDLFVLWHTGEQRGGFFVEFGAADGVHLSNSWLLEKHYGWNGILAEPARCWQNQLGKNRACTIDNRCVWSMSNNTLQFKETEEAVLSTVASFSENDEHSNARVSGHTYDVETITLVDLLVQHRAPKTIDYLSIDTEGTELEILRAFDFARFDVRIITVEHNATNIRTPIYDLLTSHGYERIFADLSHWDDWYVRKSAISSGGHIVT
jgi:FkbM family methyltransferase